MNKRVITGNGIRRKHGEAFKRDLVERSLRAGASVAAIAQENGINANLLFNWRRLHLREHGASVVAGFAANLLPVTVAAGTTTVAARPSAPMPARAATGIIEIDIGAVRVRLRGVVDEASVRCVLQTLSTLA